MLLAFGKDHHSQLVWCIKYFDDIYQLYSVRILIEYSLPALLTDCLGNYAMCETGLYVRTCIRCFLPLSSCVQLCTVWCLTLPTTSTLWPSTCWLSQLKGESVSLCIVWWLMCVLHCFSRGHSSMFRMTDIALIQHKSIIILFVQIASAIQIVRS